MITTHAHARAGLVGNPSDGYFGKTISFIIRNFRASVTLQESGHFEILPSPGDLARFDSVADFLRDVKLHGYYGGMRLVKASIKRFYDYCALHNLPLHSRNFSLSYHSDIPRLVGLAGSSAIITATFRALLQFYEIDIPLHYLPTLILSVEKDELHINAGLQDRVIQTYQGIVYMDFDRAFVQAHGYGKYEQLSPAKLPNLYVAYDPARAEISDVPHRNLRQLFEQRDPDVLTAMQKFRELTDRGRAALMSGDWDQLSSIMNENFDLRRAIINIAPENLQMIQAARSTGASAKFAGSGGAIVGIYKDESHLQRLTDALSQLRCTIILPQIF